MSVLGNVFDTLKAMSLLQLLLAFLACTGYTLAQGSLLTLRGRAAAGTISVVATLAFVRLGGGWTQNTMLVAFAVAGIGVFVAIAWVSGRLLGFGAVDPALPFHDEENAAPESEALVLTQTTKLHPPRAPMAPT